MKRTLLIILCALCACAISAPARGENTDSLYNARLEYLPYEVEMTYKPLVGTYIQKYLKSPTRMAHILALADYYCPLFWDILGQYDLPFELCYLPIIESALSPTVRSKMGATGLWQFMPSTAKIYGLEISTLVDERRDVVLSTEAACRYLKRLYEIFHNWDLAIAAYNCGSGNMRKAIARSGGKQDYWSLYPYLPHETRNYLPKYIATCYVMNYADLHGICPDSTWLYPVTDTIQLTERMHLSQIAEVLDIGLDTLRMLNPQYARDIIPGTKAYVLCLPSDQMSEFIAQQDSIRAHRAQELLP